jgi:hypothetical protein
MISYGSFPRLMDFLPCYTFKFCSGLWICYTSRSNFLVFSCCCLTLFSWFCMYFQVIGVGYCCEGLLSHCLKCCHYYTPYASDLKYTYFTLFYFLCYLCAFNFLHSYLRDILELHWAKQGGSNWTSQNSMQQQ